MAHKGSCLRLGVQVSFGFGVKRELAATRALNQFDARNVGIHRYLSLTKAYRTRLHTFRFFLWWDASNFITECGLGTCLPVPQFHPQERSRVLLASSTVSVPPSAIPTTWP
ncbi:MAG: hypothetical protein Q7S58_01705 [Candidatus Binatus sp.]|uniref:hypothetical protein n=1 Tax=Candidatus Binatus sp. TaxID=2811406 RepID=UPI0027229A34|nr:hypothetical protein [Candidatus Binatus sp.]MDO8431105.1 hypothetical protein [Candidatus Binatus sp.]